MEKFYLTNSHPEAGLVNYIEMVEDPLTNQLFQVGAWRPLITGLKHPTYTTYDFDNKLFYICNCDDILQYEVDFAHTNGEDIIYAINPEVVIKDVNCGGLTLDKFNNLFFVDQENSHIKKIKRDKLMNADRRGWLKDDIRTVYQGDLSSRARNIADIDIE